ncbi:hypothetical protein KAH55_03705 [bacterium]|nr:hypothetical protein [bacterium]
MNKNKGILLILIGIGIIFVSFFFSSGANPHQNFMTNISKMKIVVKGGEYVQRIERSNYTGKLEANNYYEGEFAIPLKIVLSFSVLLILTGTGFLLMSKNDERIHDKMLSRESKKDQL